MKTSSVWIHQLPRCMNLLLPPNLWLQLGICDIPFFAENPHLLSPDDHGYGQKHEEQRHTPERDERFIQT